MWMQVGSELTRFSTRLAPLLAYASPMVVRSTSEQKALLEHLFDLSAATRRRNEAAKKGWATRRARQSAGG